MAITQLPRLPKPPQKLYSPEHRESKAMTIALGFPCVDGIVLCSDSQMTVQGQMKYHESKIHTICSLSEKARWTVGLTYSGDPSIMKSLYEQVKNTLLEKPDAVTKKLVIETLRQALHDVHENSPDMDTEFVDVICGMAINYDMGMYVGRRTTLHEETELAFAGVGDSSLSRFLASTLPVSLYPMTTKAAQLLGVYIIEQAKQFVDGCGGDTYVITLNAADSMFSSWDNKSSQHLDELTVLAKNIQRRVHDLVETLIDVDDQEMGILENAIRETKRQTNAYYALGLG